MRAARRARARRRDDAHGRTVEAAQRIVVALSRTARTKTTATTRDGMDTMTTVVVHRRRGANDEREVGMDAAGGSREDATSRASATGLRARLFRLLRRAARVDRRYLGEMLEEGRADDRRDAGQRAKGHHQMCCR